MNRNVFLILLLSAMFTYSCQSDSKTESAAVEHSENMNLEVNEKAQNSRTISRSDIQNQNKSSGVKEQKTNFLSISNGKEFSAEKVTYYSDAKSGETTFTIAGQKVIFPDLMKNVKLRGRDSLIDKEFIMQLPGISGASELTCTIKKLGPKIPTGAVGYDQAIEGTFTGEAEGSFRLQTFTHK